MAIHGASPISLFANDPQEFVHSAVRGTISVLKGALKHGQALRRIVITASITGVMRTDAPPDVYIEANWSDLRVIVVVGFGKDALQSYKYEASKILPERAAWDFYNAHKHEVSWDLTTICQGFVFGPPADDEPDAMAATLQLNLVSLFKDANPSTPRFPPSYNYVDVRDVAAMHARTLEHAVDTVDDLGLLPLLHKTDPYAPQPPFATASSKESRQVLGIECRCAEETILSIVDDFASSGWPQYLGA
ncbi:hypothetical protein ONZ51_g12693 [Trametes cubensis]|uniref:Uncharacterized protein n=1 Tax=Trametes cubensis TaxID=1111947 RepID=A0AAD7TFL5_9APHY|nr:hypothetical protein ONZ51_g12693 [Trametes cubensis]